MGSTCVLLRVIPLHLSLAAPRSCARALQRGVLETAAENDEAEALKKIVFVRQNIG